MKTTISLKKLVTSILICTSLFFTYTVSANTNNTESLGDNVVIISEMCIGCGSCIEIADMIFEFDDNGKATIKKQPTNQEERDLVKDAQENCPMGCIFTNF